MILYREFGAEEIAQIETVYAENGWTSYLGDRERLVRAFRRSLYTAGAFEDDVLTGFVRCVGDGETILYVQDLIVRPAYHRRGIGRQLLQMASAQFPSVRQFLLITDRDDAAANAFYRAVGLSELCNGYPVTPYFRGRRN